MIRFIEVDGVLSLVSLGPVDKSAMESYLCKRADVRDVVKVVKVLLEPIELCAAETCPTSIFDCSLAEYVQDCFDQRAVIHHVVRR